MKAINNTQKFVNREEFFKLTEKDNIDLEDFLDLDYLGFFVNYIDHQNIKDSKHKICIAIASAVTSDSRVFMTNI